MTDPFIYVTNGLGAILGIVQIVLCLLFPRKIDDEPAIANDPSGMIVEESIPTTSNVQNGILPK